MKGIVNDYQKRMRCQVTGPHEEELSVLTFPAETQALPTDIASFHNEA
jgi:hypothetical protein